MYSGMKQGLLGKKRLFRRMYHNPTKPGHWQRWKKRINDNITYLNFWGLKEVKPGREKMGFEIRQFGLETPLWPCSSKVTWSKLLHLAEPETSSFVKLDYTPNSGLLCCLNEPVPLTPFINSNMLEHLLAKRCEYTTLYCTFLGDVICLPGLNSHCILWLSSLQIQPGALSWRPDSLLELSIGEFYMDILHTS